VSVQQPSMRVLSVSWGSGT